MPDEPGVIPAAPPTAPGELRMERRQSVWPMVIGIISIVFAVGGMLTNAWNAVQPYVMRGVFDAMPEDPAGMGATMEKWAGPQAATSGAGVLVSVILLTGGIQLVRRRSSAAPLLMSWAVLRILYGAAQAGVVAMMQHDVMSAAMQSAAQGGNAPFPVRGFASAMTIATVVFTLLWSWSYPAFVLWWFSRAKVRTEVRSWRGAAAP